ncbi:hypothetical protein MRB53_019353 [Persea americana]|uniref:Uncharacterized protein n=1 Tax=Persea americana TaxID=3435 RepID=A0ACC2KYS6_PERAE|nr:hypothetical protein MRB53_019353 [Persea americana]
MDKRLKLLGIDEDVLYLILNQCSLRDCIRLRAVCKTLLQVSRWSTGSSTRLPWLMMISDPNSSSVEEEEARCFFSVSDSTIHNAIKFPEIRGKRCCGSFYNANARGWLIAIDDDNFESLLFHPWRKIQLQLPDHSSLPRKLPLRPFFANMKIRTAAMSDDASVVVVVYDAYHSAFCRIGDEVWTLINPIANNSFQYICDVIYHRGQFYVVNIEGRVGVIRMNAEDPCVEFLSEEVMTDGYPRTYLVSDSERLLIFVRNSPSLMDEQIPEPLDYNIRKTLGFKVYELALEENGEWKKDPVEVKSLGDRIIFLGQNSSILFMAGQISGFKGNRIYFTDDFMEACFYKSPIGYLDLGVFNMEDKTIQRLFADRGHPILSPPIWIAPPL